MGSAPVSIVLLILCAVACATTREKVIRRPVVELSSQIRCLHLPGMRSIFNGLCHGLLGRALQRENSPGSRYPWGLHSGPCYSSSQGLLCDLLAKLGGHARRHSHQPSSGRPALVTTRLSKQYTEKVRTEMEDIGTNNLGCAVECNGSILRAMPVISRGVNSTPRSVLSKFSSENIPGAVPTGTCSNFP